MREERLKCPIDIFANQDMTEVNDNKLLSSSRIWGCTPCLLVLWSARPPL